MAKRKAAPRSRNAKQSATPLLRLKITLLRSNPPIWRRIEVPAAMTLDKLHDVLQVAMGWTDSHLHDFARAGVRYAAPHPEFTGDLEAEDTATIAVGALLTRPGETMTYQYDFGDSWYHEILLEAAIAAEAIEKRARCVDGERACPPEDVGGTYGYERFLAAIADPEHDEHEQMVEWGGSEFDAEAFDIEKVNQALKRLR
jgi:hypothetical protein